MHFTVWYFNFYLTYILGGRDQTIIFKQEDLLRRGFNWETMGVNGSSLRPQLQDLRHENQAG